MVPRTRRLRVATLAATIPLAGCMQAVNTGLGLLGLGGDRPKAESIDSEHPETARPSAAQPLGDKAHQRPRAVTSTYESAPAFWWDRYAVAPNASPARFLSQKIGQESCFLTSPGLSRVLPIQDGAPVRPIWQAGFVTVGVAGPGTDALFDPWALNSLGPAQDAVQRTARAATFGGCNRSLFLFVSLGTGTAYEPVVVR